MIFDTSLPITPLLPELLEHLTCKNRLILQAPPGAGKTTAVPLTLLDASWLQERLIVMLEPRRMAARMAAERMASLLGEKVGERVGYQIRQEGRRSAKTRILVVTEGILTRMLQGDPALEQVGCILFDEFHERSLQSDLALALSLQSQELLRDDLRLVVMSATLATEALRRMLGDAALLQSEGRSHPVSMHYLDIKTPQYALHELPEQMAKKVLHVSASEAGDILVFLPGAGEIRALQQRLHAREVSEAFCIMPLYGALPKAEQDRVMQPDSLGRRKVILSTNIAETSLTIPGVRIVIDSGLERVIQFDAASGMDTLELRFISQESATQRAGRAGREAPGSCYRLWHETKSLTPHRRSEIMSADLSSFVLELAAWGVSAPSELSFLELPPPAALEHARALLCDLQMLDSEEAITAHGKTALEFGVHPRLAHMLLRAKDTRKAVRIAALLHEGDFMSALADLSARLDALEKGAKSDATARILQSASRLEARLKRSQVGESDGVLLSLCYPDRIAQRRSGGGGSYLLANGKGAMLATGDPLVKHEYLAVAQLSGSSGRMTLAAPLSLEAIRETFADQIVTTLTCNYNSQSKRVESRECERFGALLLREQSVAKSDSEAIMHALCEGIRMEGLDVLAWDEKSLSLLQRVRFLNAHGGDMPEWSEAALLDTLEAWLGPYLEGINELRALQKLPLETILKTLLGWEREQELERLAPKTQSVPSGSKIAIDYSNPAQAVLAVRLQEMFGLAKTPAVLEGRHPLLLHLLSPAHRPMQVTHDLESFWSGAYHEVKKELRGKYKKHYWPDDPLEAQATSKTKRFMASEKRS